MIPSKINNLFNNIPFLKNKLMKYINKQTTNFKDNDQQDQRHLDSNNQMNQPFGFQQLPIVNNNFANTTEKKNKKTTTTENNHGILCM